jgi:hypothetical protein
MAAVYLSLCVTGVAQAEEITFKIAVHPDKVSAGWIRMETSPGAGVWRDVYPIPPTGSLKVTVPCVAGTLFRARIEDDHIPFDRNHRQKGCAAGEIVFLFREKTYTALIRDAVSGTALAGIYDDEVVGWQTDLTKAATENDTETSLKRSSQIYNFLIGSKNYSAAEKYRVYNFDKAKTQLGGGELAYDPFQNRFVLNKEDEAMIKQLQREYNLKATGKLDWSTMESIAKAGRPNS